MPSNRARALRRNPTEAEQRLWSILRRRQVGGGRFRRQVPFGPYITDFVCLSHRLIVEVDGGQHSERAAEDRRRTAWLESQGFRAVRFWSNEVFENREGVICVLQKVLAEQTPHPNPPPQGGRE